MDYEYDYGIHPNAKSEVYEAICETIASLYPEFKKKGELVDVDNSRCQTFENDGVVFVVCLDYYQGDVNIKSNESIEDIVEEIRRELVKKS